MRMKKPTATSLKAMTHTPKDKTGRGELIQLVVDLGALANNTRFFADFVAPAQLMAVVKADGYNHGALRIAQTALDHGAAVVGVATVPEALLLRERGPVKDGEPATIFAWMWEPAMDLTPAFDAELTLGVPSLAHARSLIDQARSRQAKPRPVVGVMADTGMSRSGISPAEWQETIALLAAAEQEGLIAVDGVFTHLASADEDAQRAVTDRQHQRFQQAIADCRAAGMAVPRNHIANTPATLTRPDMHHELVRPGLGVYGVDPVAGGTPTGTAENAVPGLPDVLPLRRTMSMRAKVITTRVVPKGESVSYGGIWTAPEDTRTAVVAAGYADGVPRSASGKMQVSINGESYQQVGRICMDQFVVALGPAESAAAEAVQPGDWAVIFGDPAAGEPSVEDLAAAAGTIPYEVVTMPRGPRVQRVVVDVEGQEHVVER